MPPLLIGQSWSKESVLPPHVPHSQSVPTAKRSSQFQRALRRHWKAPLVLGVFSALVAFALASRQTAIYESSSVVLVGNTSFQAQVQGGMSTQDPNRVLATQARLITSPEMARRVATRLSLPISETLRISQEARVTSDNISDLLTVSTRDTSPANAQRLADAFAAEFTAYRADLDTQAVRSALKDVETRLAALRRQPAPPTALLEELQQTQQDLTTRILLGSRNVAVVETASAPEQVAPRPARSAALAGGGGLLVGTLLAILLTTSDRRIRAEADLPSLPGALLGRIPLAGRRSNRSNKSWGVVMLDQPHSPQGEAFRSLATSLEMSNLGGGPRVVLVTSGTPGDGKTTVALNLSLALARLGHSVALCDFDLRAATIARRLSVPGDHGVSSVLLGHLSVDEALHELDSAHALPTGAPTTVSVLPSGPLPPNPGDFAASTGAAELLASLRSRFSITIVDSPPWPVAGDCLALSRHVDTVLLVVRLGNSLVADVTDLVSGAANSPAPVLGYVVNATPLGRTYGYGYGDNASADHAPEAPTQRR